MAKPQEKPRCKVAARRDFFVKSLLHFSKFLVNANFDLLAKYILRKRNKYRFRWYIDCTEMLSIFHARVEYTCFSNTLTNAIQTNGEKKTFTTSPSPFYMRTPSNTPIPRLTQLATPNAIQIQSAVFPQFTHRTDRQTYRQTEGRSRRQTCKNTRLHSIVLMESDAADNKLLMVLTELGSYVSFEKK